MTKTAERVQLREASRRLSGGRRPSPAELLRDGASYCEAGGVDWDEPVRERFEARVAKLLGYPAARFLPSGTMAQSVALRIWCERARVATVGMHPTSHVELHEARGYAHLFHLQARLIGPRDRPMLAHHVDAVKEPLGALMTELPIREAGGQLPTWDQLEALKAAARQRGVRLHVDGARLWCCGEAYGRPLSDITRGFDSCYVSFYKSVGALPGAMLLGPEDFVAEAAVWQRRMGGDLHTLVPNVVTAAMRLDHALDAMPRRLKGARALSAALAGLPGLQAFPDPPHTPMFHVILDLARQDAFSARDQVARETGIWLFSGLMDGPAPGTTRFELTIDEGTLDLDPGDVRRAFESLLG